MKFRFLLAPSFLLFSKFFRHFRVNCIAFPSIKVRKILKYHALTVYIQWRYNKIIATNTLHVKYIKYK